MSDRRWAGRRRLAFAGQLALPVLVPIAAVTYLWGQNTGFVRPADAIQPLVVTVGIAAGTHAFLIAVTRQISRSALTVAVAALVALTFGYQLDALGVAADADADAEILRWALVVANVAGLALAVALIWRSRADLAGIAAGSAMVCAIFVGLSLPRVAADLPETGLDPRPAGSAEVVTHVGPDIYYILLDGYGREDVLEEIFGYSNEPFLHWLEERGFYVAGDALANYTRTHLSLASSLNMRYLDELPPNLTPEAGEALAAMLREPAAVTALQREGYRYVHFDTIWWGTAEAPRADVTFGTGAGSEFEAVFFNSTLPGRILPLPTWQEEHLRTLSHLPEVAEMPDSTIAFAHVLLPHPPFVFDAGGKQVRRGVELGGSWSDREAYIEQLRFVNSWLQTMIGGILDRSTEPPIIVLQSDHGPWSTAGAGPLSSDSRWERTAILSAYLVPSSVRDDLYPSISPVNTFRLLLSTLFGEHLPLLDDRAMFSPSDTDPRVDVTQELRGR